MYPMYIPYMYPYIYLFFLFLSLQELTWQPVKPSCNMFKLFVINEFGVPAVQATANVCI